MLLQNHLQQRCVAEEEEREMQVDVYDGSVLVLPGWENHLEGTEAERLREKKQQCKRSRCVQCRRQSPKQQSGHKIKGSDKKLCVFRTTCSCPGGGMGTKDSLAENSFIVSSKSACLVGRSSTRRLKTRETLVGSTWRSLRLEALTVTSRLPR